MDGRAFDEATKAIATGRSRRAALRTLGVGVLGLVGLVGAQGAGTQSANGQCRDRGSNCMRGKGTPCCSGCCKGGVCRRRRACL